MKRKKMQTANRRRSYQLATNQVVSLDLRNVRIDCVQGLIWVTWPDGHERVLHKAQSLSVRSTGIICVQAFAASTLVVRETEKRAPLCAPDYLSPCPEVR